MITIRISNIRLSYAWDDDQQEVTTLEEHHYYPFGLEHKYYNSTRKEFKKRQTTPGNIMVRPTQVANSGYQYQYNGKEWQDELGLNMTAMDFRQYDNALGRFVGMDRLSELSYSISPYRFAFNNPVYWNDPSGLFESRKEARRYKRENDIKGKVKKNSDGTFSIHGKNGTEYTKGNDYKSIWVLSSEYDLHPNDGVVESVLVSSKKNTKRNFDQNPSYWGYSKSNSDNIGYARDGYGDYNDDAPVTTMGGGGGAVTAMNSWAGFVQWLAGLFVTTQSGTDAVIEAMKNEKTYDHNEASIEKNNNESVVNEPAIKVELLKLNIADVNYKGVVQDANYQLYDTLVNTKGDSTRVKNKNIKTNDSIRNAAKQKWNRSH